MHPVHTKNKPVNLINKPSINYNECEIAKKP